MRYVTSTGVSMVYYMSDSMIGSPHQACSYRKKYEKKHVEEEQKIHYGATSAEMSWMDQSARIGNYGRLWQRFYEIDTSTAFNSCTS